MEVTKYKKLENGGNVVAFLSIKIPEWHLTINDCREVRTKNGGKFIAMPSRPYEENGEKKYAPIVFFERDVSDKLQAAIKKAIDDYLKTQGGQCASNEW